MRERRVLRELITWNSVHSDKLIEVIYHYNMDDSPLDAFKGVNNCIYTLRSKLKANCKIERIRNKEYRLTIYGERRFSEHNTR